MANIQRWVNAHGQTEQTEINRTPNTLTQAVRRLIDLIGEKKYQAWEQSQKMAVRYDRAELLKAVNFEYNRLTMLSRDCACENCQFVRTAWAWIGAQKVRLELEEMTPGYRVTVQESIDHETNRMNKVIMGGCNVIK